VKLSPLIARARREAARTRARPRRRARVCRCSQPAKGNVRRLVLWLRALGRSSAGPPLTPSHNYKGDQEEHDPNEADDVRRDGHRTRNVARVRPDETDDCPHDEHGDHGTEPVQNPSSSDDAEPTPLERLRQLARTGMRRAGASCRPTQDRS